MKYFSMFSGIGGFEYGIERAFNEVEQRRCGQEKNSLETALSDTNSEPNKRQSPYCVGFSEVDKYAIQIYKKHFPKHKEYGDARRIIPEEIPDFDLLVGGFPCQSFSIAGKRGGFKDTRGTLFYEIARIASVKRPKLLLLENVKGLLSHDKGRTFGTILATLSDLGYILEWQVLNSKNFGVPQNRERVFIIGHLGEIGGQAIFPVFGSGEATQSHPCIDAHYYKGYSNQRKILRTDKPDTRQERDKSNGSNSIRRRSYSDGMRIRRLTPTECERLQGFPDNWVDGISNSQKYKCLGNAVTTNVITAIMNKLLDKPKSKEDDI